MSSNNVTKRSNIESKFKWSYDRTLRDTAGGCMTMRFTIRDNHLLSAICKV